MKAFVASCAFIVHFCLVATTPHHSDLNILSRRQKNRDCNAPGYGKYACIKCDLYELADQTATPEEKWAAADGDAAWEAVKRWWTIMRESQGGAKVPDGPLGSVQGFVPEISWYWQGPEFLNCEDIGETHCDNVVKCEDTDNPAASMVLTAFANINMFYNNLYDGIKDAESSMTAKIGLFTKEFAPQAPDTLKALKIFIDIFGLAYIMIGAGFWNKIIREAPFFKNRGNDHAWAKDSANGFVASAVILAKDAQPGVQGQINTQNDLSAVLASLVDGWSKVTASYVTSLFSGSDESLLQLDAYVKGGVWSDPGFTNARPELQAVMENILYGGLIQEAWQEHESTNPVIIFQPGSDNTNPLKPLKENPGGLDDKDAVAARTQYGGTTLWLLNAADPCFGKTGEIFQDGSCEPNFLKPLAGASKLVPDNPWGGVLLDDITISAFVGWQINGDKNGYEMPEDGKLTDASGQSADLPFEAGIRTPGFFSKIPVCDIETVAQAARPGGENRGAKKCDTYPCC